jgi:hypothetical protein
MFCKEVYPLINTEKDDTVLIEKEGLINSLIVNTSSFISISIFNNNFISDYNTFTYLCSTKFSRNFSHSKEFFRFS